MRIQLLESSLNLRIERGKKKEDYTLGKFIAERQMSIAGTDIFTNVEFMDCDNAEYLQVFKQAGYHSDWSLDAHGRGILCEIKSTYEVTKIGEMSEPHMLHLRIQKDQEVLDLITLRILVAGGGDADFQDRNRQWNKVLKYIESLPDTSHLILTGDFNHGVISDSMSAYHCRPRQYFNYQMITDDLKHIDIKLHPIEGCSFQGYLRIDHIATGKRITVENAVYKELFDTTKTMGIGIPDHSSIVAILNTV